MSLRSKAPAWVFGVRLPAARRGRGVRGVRPSAGAYQGHGSIPSLSSRRAVKPRGVDSSTGAATEALASWQGPGSMPLAALLLLRGLGPALDNGIVQPPMGF